MREPIEISCGDVSSLELKEIKCIRTRENKRFKKPDCNSTMDSNSEVKTRRVSLVDNKSFVKELILKKMKIKIEKQSWVIQILYWKGHHTQTLRRRE